MTDKNLAAKCALVGEELLKRENELIKEFRPLVHDRIVEMLGLVEV